MQGRSGGGLRLPVASAEMHDRIQLCPVGRLPGAHLIEENRRHRVHLVLLFRQLCRGQGYAGISRMLGKEPNKDVLLVGYDHYWEDSL